MNPVTGLVLAGGLARRMGGGDKGLLPFRGKPMVSHVIKRLAPQVQSLIINANQNRDAYAALGYPVVADIFDGYAGPLAGLHAGLTACTTPFVVTAPCDSPFLPLDLVERLHGGLVGSDVQLAVAHCGEYPQRVFTLCRRDVLDSLSLFLRGGGRKINHWYEALRVVEVTFPDEAAFANINTHEELERLEKP